MKRRRRQNKVWSHVRIWERRSWKTILVKEIGGVTFKTIKRAINVKWLRW
jgi:hypothetical protein